MNPGPDADSTHREGPRPSGAFAEGEREADEPQRFKRTVKRRECRAPSARVLILAGVFGLIVALQAQPNSATLQPSGMVLIPAGVYRPLFRSENDAKEIPGDAFYLDVLPVTNAEFVEFVRANPRWRRSQVKRLFADENYLEHWAGDLDPGLACRAHQPVTGIRNQRRSGIGDQRHRLVRHRRQQPIARARIGVIVITLHFLAEPKVMQQPTRHPRILARNQRAAPKHFDRSQSHVAEIANRRGDNIQPRFKQ